MNDRQARDLPLDAHLHTNLSPDSEVQIDTFASQAVERGIPEIAITDHVDFEPGAPAYRYVSFADRERSVREAAERWAEHGLAIRFGVEVTWDSRWADDIRDHLATHAYDFTIGSVHVYGGSPYEASNVGRWVAGRSLAEIMEPYFSEVERAIRSGLFDAIGHLDVVKRYLAPHVTAADLGRAPELYEPLLHALVEGGAALGQSADHGHRLAVATAAVPEEPHHPVLRRQRAGAGGGGARRRLHRANLAETVGRESLYPRGVVSPAGGREGAS